MLKRTRRFAFPVVISGILLLVALAACGVSAGSPMRSETISTGAVAPAAMVDDGVMMDMEESAGEAFGGEADRMQTLNQNAPQEQQQERIILKDANISIIVEDTESTITSITALAEGMGGWVVTANSNTQQRADEDYTTGNITVRVPAENLDSVMNTIREGAIRVDSENVNGRDVTEEYVDLSSRLSNLKATEEQLAEVMDNAFTVEDILAVQRELTRVRGEIEVIEGRLRFFDEAAAFSSVAVSVREEIPTVGNIEVAGWNPGETAENAFGALIVVGQFLVDSVIVLAILGLPVVAVLWVVFMVVRRMWRNRRGRRQVTATE